ncbi:hypothetical protein [Nucisporomicrobium flavum]|uniref:hypothetical protein n=1 Tax=Nucisporomicrobium flavum TaxID=2785915 RepID=UPI001F4818F0|nr:hypothetical protein [Nucisporomicrobium flavum]
MLLRSDGRASSSRPLIHAARTVAAVLVLAVAAYVTARILASLAPMTMAIIAALLLTALIAPLTMRLKRWHLPATVAALTTVVGLLTLLAEPRTSSGGVPPPSSMICRVRSSRVSTG